LHTPRLFLLFVLSDPKKEGQNKKKRRLSKWERGKTEAQQLENRKSMAQVESESLGAGGE